MNILILSDGRMGHVNQSIAFAKHCNATYEVIQTIFTCKLFKILSYVLDFFKIYTSSIFKLSNPIAKTFDLVVSAGSNTYYANKTIAKLHHIKSVTMMLPKGYRYDFDTIFAQLHDNPPTQQNIFPIPANFSFTEPKGFFLPSQKSIGIIIGGNNAIFTMQEDKVKTQLDFIFAHFKGYDIAVTTSPRTPKSIENLLEHYPFSYQVIYSHNPINPIGDFLHHCEVVFITIDSTSMISEAISYGASRVEVLPLSDAQNNKFYTMSKTLEEEGYLNICDGEVAHNTKKIDFKSYAQKALV